MDIRNVPVDELKARVARGVAILDQRKTNWRDDIGDVPLTNEDLEDFCGCVLGRTFGQFSAGLNALRLRCAFQDSLGGSAAEHGFTLYRDESGYGEPESSSPVAEQNWRNLAEAWNEALTS